MADNTAQDPNNKPVDDGKSDARSKFSLEKKDDGFDQEMEAPDNGPWYCSYCNWLGSMYERFDGTFVTFFIVQNINHGLWVAATLAVKDYYKEYLHLDPGEMQIYISIIHIPWSFKILYGLISDNVPIFGTRRKSWLVIMGLVQFATLFSLALSEPEEPLAVAFLLASASLSEAFVNVVSDAVMVIQSRKDPQFGSQDFVTLLYLSTGFGGIIGCIYGGLMTEYFHPKWVWFYYSFFGIVVATFAFFLTAEAEEDALMQPTESDISTSQEDFESAERNRLIENGMTREEARAARIEKRDNFCYNLKKNCQAIGRAITMREIYQLVLFFVIQGILNPSFSEFSYFFLMNVIGVSKFLFSVLVLVGQICHVIGALIYKAFFRGVDTRVMIIFATITHIIGAFFNYMFAMRWNLEIDVPDLVFLFFTDVVFSVVQTLLYTLPIIALFAKITPKRIEGTTFAFLTGTMNLASTVISPGIGTWINYQFVGVNKKDLSRWPILCLIVLCCATVSLVLIFLIPTKQQIREFRFDRDKAYEEKKQERRDRRKKKAEDRAAQDPEGGEESQGLLQNPDE